MVEASAGVVYIYRKADGGSRRHGAAGPRRWPRDDVCAQGGGAVWHRGGVDGRPDKVDALVPEDEDGLEEDGGGDFFSVCINAAESLLDRLCPLLAIGRLGVASMFLDDARWCVRRRSEERRVGKECLL